jgi:hypothetical protein
MLTTTFTGLVLNTYFNGGKEAKYANKEGSEVVDQMSGLKVNKQLFSFK